MENTKGRWLQFRLPASAPDETVSKLRSIAKSLGFVITRGPMRGDGNIGAMLVAIANGELIVKPKNSGERPPDEEPHMEGENGV